MAEIRRCASSRWLSSCRSNGRDARCRRWSVLQRARRPLSQSGGPATGETPVVPVDSREFVPDVRLAGRGDEAECLVGLYPSEVHGRRRREEAFPEVCIGTDEGCVRAFWDEGAEAVAAIERGRAKQLEAHYRIVDIRPYGTDRHMHDAWLVARRVGPGKLQFGWMV